MMFDDIFQSKDLRCTNCNHIVKEEDKYCPHCGHLCEVNDWQECGPDRCGNCHEYLDPEDKYCKICGTKVGEGKFEPFRNIIQCIYGPMPVERTHTCKKCGYVWINCQMIDNERYCPQCGGRNLKITEEGEDTYDE